MPLVKVLHHDLPSAVTLVVSDFITRRRLLRADQLPTRSYPKDFVSSRWCGDIGQGLGRSLAACSASAAGAWVVSAQLARNRRASWLGVSGSAVNTLNRVRVRREFRSSGSSARSRR